MVWKLFLVGAIALVASLCAGLLFVGCASGQAQGSGDLGPFKWEFKVGTNGEDEAHVSGSLPPGKCLEVKFLGSDGSVLGTSTIGVPGYAQVPPGTVGFFADVVDCDTLQVGVPMGASHELRSASWHEVVYVPLTPDVLAFDPLRNTQAHLRLRLPAGVDPVEAAMALIEAGPGAMTGPDIEVEFFGQVLPYAGGARLRVADDEPIVAFDMSWNGVDGYAGLTSPNTAQVVLDNGWHMVLVDIPLAHFDLAPLSWNGGDVTVRSASASTPSNASAQYQVP